MAPPHAHSARVAGRSGPKAACGREGRAKVTASCAFHHPYSTQASRPHTTPRHPGLTSEQQRHDALDTEASRRRYQALLQRERQGLEPLMERDLVAERRVRTVY